MKRSFILSLIATLLLGLSIVFAPVFKGRVVCGITEEGGCWRDKVNLVEYFQDYERIRLDNKVKQ